MNAYAMGVQAALRKYGSVDGLEAAGLGVLALPAAYHVLHPHSSVGDRVLGGLELAGLGVLAYHPIKNLLTGGTPPVPHKQEGV